MIDGFQPKKISDEYIERIIDQETGADSTTLLSTIVGYGFRTSGHFFFLINLLALQRTLLYDIEEKLWHEWQCVLPIDPLTESVDTFNTNFCYNYAAAGPSSEMHFQSAYSPTINYLSTTLEEDSHFVINPMEQVLIFPINMLIRTNKYDMDTINRKRLHSLRLVSDYTQSTETSTLTIKFTDNDYESYSSDYTVSLDTDFPILYQLGSFRRRAFQIECTTGHDMRFEALEFLYVEDNS